MRRTLIVILLSGPGLVLLGGGSVRADGLEGLTIEPQAVDIGAFFNGKRLEITGEIPSSGDLLVELTGPAVDSTYDVQGQLGPFWMTTDKVELKDAPRMYILLLPSGEEWPRRAASLGWGLESLESRISISQTQLSKDDVFGMFIDTKRAEGKYAEVAGAISYAAAAGGRKRFTAVCELPPSTAPGKYMIKVSVLDGGKQVDDLSTELDIQEVGFVKFVHDLAMGRGLIYGILAVIIALATGMIMALVLKGGGGH